MNILLVDDDLDDILLFRQAIKDINKAIDCVEFETGTDLLNYLFIAPYMPRIIFLDYNMPIMDGLKVLEEIRANEKYDDVHIVMYTTYLSNDQKVRAERLAASIMYKPDNYSELVEGIESRIMEVMKPDVGRHHQLN